MVWSAAGAGRSDGWPDDWLGAPVGLAVEGPYLVRSEAKFFLASLRTFSFSVLAFLAAVNSPWRVRFCPFLGYTQQGYKWSYFNLFATLFGG